MKNGKIRRFRPRSNKHYSGRRSNGSIKNNSVHNIDGPRNNFLGLTMLVKIHII